MTQFALMCATILAQGAIDARNNGGSVPVVERATQEFGCFEALVRAVNRKFSGGVVELRALGPDDRAADDVVATLEIHPEMLQAVLDEAARDAVVSGAPGTGRLDGLRRRFTTLIARSGMRRVLGAGS